ncbi:caspase family protein [Oscillatoriales cyanobacterium LEGE 11467]|uniref:Caspase family protein n=1 Tax=Zarconia navalis LEGE 11467 TaxID=1828826 RepID=A0A928VTS6_9CYAN|nr:caspase family protein [Zarconia navalis]MBE9040011.1 caspase family protein [Zarconia navalis LEGE 11467]
MKRRHFLQFASSTLATLGLSQLDIVRQGDRYGKVLAQSTPRKLALLVGINDYSGDSWNSLKGCATDVLMQKNLLMYGFGFKEEDILVLTDEDKPANVTRDSILTAFEEHLIAQAKPGDVAVFHYSGHGSQIQDPDGISADGLNSTFVPIDSPIVSDEGGIVNDIMGRTLFLLMRAVKTDNLTVVLDSCHSGGGTRGNLTVRSRSGGVEFLPSEEELAFQEKWISKLDLSEEELKEVRENIAKGVVIASAQREQLAADASFNGFHAGAFTYLMTRYLWQQTRPEPVKDSIFKISRSLSRVTNLQKPLVECNPEENSLEPLYLTEMPRPSAEGVITQKLGNDRVKLWLGGVNRYSLEAFKEGTKLSVLDRSGQKLTIGDGPPVEIELKSREGLVGVGHMTNGNGGRDLEPGMFVREEVRSIPLDFHLRVGIDDRAFDTESITTAQQALNALFRIQAMPLEKEDVQYVLAPMTSEYREQLTNQNDLPPVGSLGLFSPVFDEAIPDSFGAVGESVSEAVNRLQTKLQSLLVARLFKLVINPESSRLNVEVIMRSGVGEVLGTTFTPRGGSTPPKSSINEASASALPQFRPGDFVEFEFKNNEGGDLYVTVLLISPDRSLTSIFPSTFQNPEEDSLIPGNSTRIIPDVVLDGFQFQIANSPGLVEVLVVASRTPLRETLKVLQTLAEEVSTDYRGPVGTSSEAASDLVDGLFEDLNSVKSNNSEARDSFNDGLKHYAPAIATVLANVNQMAALSISFEVV